MSIDDAATPQLRFLQERRREMEEINDAARSLAAGVSAERLSEAPPGGGWSVAQVFQHLVVAGEDYLRLMRPALADAAASGVRDPGREWRPTLAGRLLVHSLRPGRSGSLRSPRAWHPGAPRAGALDEFLACQGELAALAREAEGIDITGVRTHSPVSKLIRLNLGDCFLILNVHAQRHLGQIRRIGEQLRLPTPLA